MTQVRTLSFGIVDGRAVFMDERTDSYFMLDCDQEEDLNRLAERSGPLSSGADLNDLLGVGNEPIELIRAGYTSPSVSLLDGKVLRGPSLSAVIKAARLVRATRTWLRTQPIAAVLTELSEGPSALTVRSVAREDLVDVASRFLGARKFVPVPGNCLLDALSMLRWLGPCRNAVALIFGAKLDPFAAHCWVQVDDLVLNDHVESVAAFTPVRVIRCSEATP